MDDARCPAREVSQWRCVNLRCCTELTLVSSGILAIQCPICGHLDMARLEDANDAADSGGGRDA